MIYGNLKSYVVTYRQNVCTDVDVIYILLLLKLRAIIYDIFCYIELMKCQALRFLSVQKSVMALRGEYLTEQQNIMAPTVH